MANLGMIVGGGLIYLASTFGYYGLTGENTNYVSLVDAGIKPIGVAANFNCGGCHDKGLNSIPGDFGMIGLGLGLAGLLKGDSKGKE